MTLDSETQREVLLELFATAQVQVPLAKISEVQDRYVPVLEAVKTATVAQTLHGQPGSA